MVDLWWVVSFVEILGTDWLYSMPVGSVWFGDQATTQSQFDRSYARLLQVVIAWTNSACYSAFSTDFTTASGVTKAVASANYYRHFVVM